MIQREYCINSFLDLSREMTVTRWTHKETDINEKTDCLKYYRLSLREGHSEERNLQIFSSSADNF